MDETKIKGVYKCPICGETSCQIKSRGGFHKHQPKDVWAVDVDHETMTVRGQFTTTEVEGQTVGEEET